MPQLKLMVDTWPTLAHADPAATVKYVVAAGALVASLLVIVAAVFIARAIVRKASESRSACRECGHFLDADEEKCPFCGAERTGDD